MASILNTFQEQGLRRERTAINVGKELAELKRMTVRELREKHEGATGQHPSLPAPPYLGKQL